MQRKIKFKIFGIHCKSCKSLIEGEVELLKGIKSILVDDKTHMCHLTYDSNEVSLKEIKSTIENLNYEVGPLIKESLQPGEKNVGLLNKFILLLAFIAVVSGLYFLALRFGFFEILAKLNEKNLSYYLIFFIGLLASFHCMGMCGGMVIAYSSRFCVGKSRKEMVYPHLMYNSGRLVSYTLTGIILGSIGSFFAISRSFNGAVTLLAGLFMIAVGITLMGKISFLEKITGILPVFVGKWVISLTQGKTPKAPFVIGFFNGFMPCGPLQAMQIYALASGSGIVGGLSMASYALGTIPFMFLFGNFISFLSRERIALVMKVSGVIVILLGIFTLNRGLMNFRSVPIVKTEDAKTIVSPSTNNNQKQNQNFQEVRMDLTYEGYSPNTLNIKKGIPVRFIVNAKEISNCTSEILIPEFNISKKLSQGENVIEFTPTHTGEIKFSCGMRMVWGKFIVN